MLPYSTLLAEELTTDNSLDIGYGMSEIMTVLIVLALIVGLIVLLIRFLAHKNNSWFSTRSVRHLGGIGVGQNKSVQLVKIGSSVYIVGVGQDVKLLGTIDDQAEIDSIMESLAAPSTLTGFNWLNKWKKKLSPTSHSRLSADELSSPEAESFQELFHSKMQQVGNKNNRLQELLDNDRDGKPL